MNLIYLCYYLYFTSKAKNNSEKSKHESCCHFSPLTKYLQNMGQVDLFEFLVEFLLNFALQEFFLYSEHYWQSYMSTFNLFHEISYRDDQ